jgi:hypothetical protein
LWDNGKEAADELNRVLAIRSVVMKRFGENNIRPGMPMATLEEVLVPMYFFHRYQAEAAVKVVGGLHYRYALRGDGQPATEMVDPAQQQKALDALLKTLSPSTLMLPENVLKILPPRPIGYSRHREVIEIRTELTFDALGAAESAADMTARLLLNAARAGRLVEYHARDSRQPGLEFVIDRLMDATIKSPVKNGYEGAVQMTVNGVVLNNLVKLALNQDASGQVRAVAYYKIGQWKGVLSGRLKAELSEDWRAHYSYLLAQIAKFQENPDEYRQDLLLTPPPGQPIGNYGLDFCGD